MRHMLCLGPAKKDLLKRIPQLIIGPDTGINNINRINEIQKRFQQLRQLILETHG